MPSKVRDSSLDQKVEKNDSKADRPDRKSRGDKERKYRSSHPHRKSSTKDKEKTSSRTSLSSTDSRRRSSMPSVAEERPLSQNESRPSLPYPTFSKEHSKEAVGSRPSLNIFTPPATDLNASKEKLANLNRVVQNSPPSPPLTDKNAGQPKTSPSKPVVAEVIPEEKPQLEKSKIAAKLRPKVSVENKHVRSSSDVASSTSPIKIQKERSSTPLKSVENQVPKRSVSQPTRSVPAPFVETATEIGTNVSSDVTSVATQQPRIQRPDSSIPQTVPSPFYGQPEIIYIDNPDSRQQTPLTATIGEFSAASTPGSNGPPPPPPPPNVPVTIPRVDYLLQYGGLHHSVPKNLLYAGKPMAVQQAAFSPGAPPVMIANLFEPYNQLLDDFTKVMDKNGSLAVATGYKSVARRLLDRLEAVFARDISCEDCTCCMCEYDNDQISDGVSWGEVLELVSGRRDLPPWPPFAFVASPTGLGLTLEMQMQAPMQKLDIDVPEEFREHYIRQSKRTKQSVDKWLNRQGDDQSSPPEEVDDETLTFAILTHISADQRQIFKDLLGIVDRPLEPPKRAPSPEHNQPPRPAPTPQPKSRAEHVIIAGQAIQRLYRLSEVPRDPETALYLLNNPTMHNPLATLAAVSADEWDILISGRFDGFLRSGADDVAEVTPANGRYTPGLQRGPSRGATPAYFSGNRSRQNSLPIRPGTAPIPSMYHEPSAKHGAPIAFDEETEIATLAEIERDIYVGMEALEDAFEQLHLKAESIRRAIRERSAGLSLAQQRRRSAAIEVRMGTPGPMIGEGLTANGLYRWDMENDDGFGDDVSELAPDDSASNISSARRRRRGGLKRRNERMKTPVIPIDEADEDDYDEFAESEGTSSPRKR